MKRKSNDTSIDSSLIREASEMRLKRFIALISSTIVLSVIFAFPLSGFYYILMSIEKINAIYLTGPNLSDVYVTSFLLGLVVSLRIRLSTFKLLFKKDYEQMLEIDREQNTPGDNKFFKGLTVFIIFFCLLSVMLVVKSNIKFEKDGFIDNTGYSLKWNYYPYAEVQKVYYKPTRTDKLGEVEESPSYVIVIKSGKEIDLYGSEDVLKSREYLVPILKGKGIQVPVEIIN